MVEVEVKREDYLTLSNLLPTLLGEPLSADRTGLPMRQCRRKSNGTSSGQLSVLLNFLSLFCLISVYIEPTDIFYYCES